MLVIMSKNEVTSIAQEKDESVQYNLCQLLMCADGTECLGGVSRAIDTDVHLSGKSVRCLYTGSTGHVRAYSHCPLQYKLYGQAHLVYSFAPEPVNQVCFEETIFIRKSG